MSPLGELSSKFSYEFTRPWTDRGYLTPISGCGRGCDQFWSKYEGYVTWLVGSESGLEGSKEQTARRPARH